jgi:hypothetical protein
MPVQWLTDAGGLAEPFEIYSTVRETWSNERLGASVALRCPWADRYSVLYNILANALAWPYNPGSGMRAVSGAVSPFLEQHSTQDGQGIAYVDARLDINFEAAFLSNNPPGGGQKAIYQETIEPNGEFITIPPADFEWSDGTPIKNEEAPGRLMIGMDYRITWLNLVAIPVECGTLIDAVNVAQVISPSLGLVFPPETLLFIRRRSRGRLRLVAQTCSRSMCGLATARTAGINFGAPLRYKVQHVSSECATSTPAHPTTTSDSKTSAACCHRRNQRYPSESPSKFPAWSACARRLLTTRSCPGRLRPHGRPSIAPSSGSAS